MGKLLCCLLSKWSECISKPENPKNPTLITWTWNLEITKHYLCLINLLVYHCIQLWCPVRFYHRFFWDFVIKNGRNSSNVARSHIRFIMWKFMYKASSQGYPKSILMTSPFSNCIWCINSFKVLFFVKMSELVFVSIGGIPWYSHRM